MDKDDFLWKVALEKVWKKCMLLYLLFTPPFGLFPCYNQLASNEMCHTNKCHVIIGEYFRVWLLAILLARLNGRMYVPGKLIYVAVYSNNAKIHFDVNTYLLFLNYIKCQEMNLQRDAEKFLFFAQKQHICNWKFYGCCCYIFPGLLRCFSTSLCGILNQSLKNHVDLQKRSSIASVCGGKVYNAYIKLSQPTFFFL